MSKVLPDTDGVDLGGHVSIKEIILAQLDGENSFDEAVVEGNIVL